MEREKAGKHMAAPRTGITGEQRAKPMECSPNYPHTPPRPPCSSPAGQLSWGKMTSWLMGCRLKRWMLLPGLALKPLTFPLFPSVSW